MIKSVIHTQCGTEWSRREATHGRRSEVSTEQREEATLEGKWGEFRGDSKNPLPEALKTCWSG